MNIDDIFKRIITDGDTVLDVGGHVGNVAWFMTRCVGPSGKVFSFEPHPELFKALRAKAEKYPNLEAVPCAVSNSPIPVTLYFGVTEASNQASTIRADLVTKDLLGEEIHSTEVASVTLDQFCADRGLHPAVIKIDVEGAEKFVLEGADAVLATNPILVFEMGVTNNLPDHVENLFLRGYELYFVDMYRFVSEPASWNDIVSSETRPLRNCLLSFAVADAEKLAPFLSNVLAVPPNKRAMLNGLRIMPLIDAAPLFADPKRSASIQIKRTLRRLLIPPFIEKQCPGLVGGIRNIVKHIL